jgi:N-acetyl-gamma-glutamyl-phosphate/LysW-gamma-L-alpha-aminoadipyl-6-phosphate reductase
MAQASAKKINVGIIGGAGYGGTELVKLLLFHPEVNLTFVTSRKNAGKKLSSVSRFLSGVTDLVFVEPDVEKLPKDTDCVFFATPHGTSMFLAPLVIREMPRARIVDLSGDFRLDDPKIYRQYYGRDHASPGLLKDFVYGIPEMNRVKVAEARYVANPGCFATGIIFALYPLLKGDILRREVSVVAVTGSSGAGEEPKDVTHHPVRAKNFKSYKILEHQHLPEIERYLRDSFPGWKGEIGFVPQSGPFVRGIFTTATLYNDGIDADVLKQAFVGLYGREKFVRIVDGSPEVAVVYASNYVEVSCLYRKNFVVSMSAIDNLVRGASGQAVQNMNIMFGFRESLGIEFPGMRP